MSGARIGIDVGGTFTDGILVDGGHIRVAKVPSRPRDTAGAIIECCAKLGADLRDVSLLIHGTTIATNAIIEKTGPTIAHVTTAGYRDILYIRRGDSQPYDLAWEPPTPVVRRRDIHEVPERIAADRSVLVEFDEAAARRIATILREKAYKAVSVVFLHSYRNGAHERRMREVLAEECPGIPVCLSCEVLPHYREFERSTTTAVNAYLMPLMTDYLDLLKRRLADGGFRGEPLTMQSNGGVMTLDEAKRLPARTARSGPAGGTIAAVRLAERLALDDAILIDIGGTSTEVAVRHRGALRWRPELEFAWGVPIRFPSIEIESIGAGGGSIAWVEAGRFLKVGPRSAGADPGPACFGRGGRLPTTTDAQVVLGRLDPDALLDGSMPIHRELAAEAIAREIAGPLGMSLEDAARGILRVNTNNTMQAIRLMTVNRGLDPRSASLIAYGGSGPLYAAEVARLLGIRRIVIPAHSGVTSALGMVQADFEYDQSMTLLQPERAVDFAALAATFAGLEDAVVAQLAAAGVPASRRVVERYVDLRYEGQGFELPVVVPAAPGGGFDRAGFEALKARFHAQHAREFGWQRPDWPTELVFARVTARGVIPDKPDVRLPAGGSAAAARRQRRCQFLDGDGWVDTPLIRRGTLGAGARFHGPAIVEQMDTTTLVPPGFRVTVDDMANMILEDGSGSGEHA